MELKYYHMELKYYYMMGSLLLRRVAIPLGIVAVLSTFQLNNLCSQDYVA